MADPVRVFSNGALYKPEADPHTVPEWLVTNGLGGYASGTVTGAITRRYHGLLIAAFPNPLGRMMMLNGLSERLRLPDRRVVYTGAAELTGVVAEETLALQSFRLESGLPVWRYEVDGFVLEKRLVMPYGQNTVHVTYLLLEGKGTLRLGLKPAIHFRSHDAPVSQPGLTPYKLSVDEDQFEIMSAADLSVLRFFICGSRTAFTFDRKETSLIPYHIEHERGYEWQGSLWSPGYFRAELNEGDRVTLVASTEAWDTIRKQSPEESLRAELERRTNLLAVAHPKAQSGAAAEWVLAADQFIIAPAGRREDPLEPSSVDKARTIIAGYPWFTDWGRDTMISLEGLTMLTGRTEEAGQILRTFAHYVRDGLIPNMFPEGEREGLYHTADATLWFFHAIHRYVLLTHDETMVAMLLPKLMDIIDHHVKGTWFGIGMDPQDALMRQGEGGYQLTWMDAKVDDWVVTPRRGKAVEINALWYNALRLMQGWLKAAGQQADGLRMEELANRVKKSFNERFWNEQEGYLYDVVDAENGGNDAACRPNQLFALSLDHPVLDETRWKPVMDVVTARLLTPVGLRSLAPGHPDYKARYFGDLRARDAAYHQGTVWGWLIGPYVDVWLRLNPGKEAQARGFLQGFVDHLNEACLGSISEIFDAEAPYTPRGCVAQAWSVAEVLRCWTKTAGA